MDLLVVRVMRMRRRRAKFYCCLTFASSAMMMVVVTAWKSCADAAAFPHAAARFDTCFYASLLFSTTTAQRCLAKIF